MYKKQLYSIFLKHAHNTAFLNALMLSRVESCGMSKISSNCSRYKQVAALERDANDKFSALLRVDVTITKAVNKIYAVLTSVQSLWRPTIIKLRISGSIADRRIYQACMCFNQIVFWAIYFILTSEEITEILVEAFCYWENERESAYDLLHWPD